MKAIRVDGTEVISWNALLARQNEHNLHSHSGLFFYWQAREGLTDDQADAAIEAGRIEWGSIHWNSKSGEFPFTKDQSRQSAYRNIETVRFCAP